MRETTDGIKDERKLHVIQESERAHRQCLLCMKQETYGAFRLRGICRIFDFQILTISV